MKATLLSLAVAGGTLAAHASVLTVSASLDGLGSGPIATGSAGLGSATGTLDTLTGLLTLSGSYQDLESDALLVYIARPDSTFLVDLEFTTPPGTSGDFGTFSGTVLLGTDVAALLSGGSSLNISTGQYTDAEISGYLVVVPEPQAMALIGGFGLAAFAGYRRLRR